MKIKLLAMLIAFLSIAFVSCENKTDKLEAIKQLMNDTFEKTLETAYKQLSVPDAPKLSIKASKESKPIISMNQHKSNPVVMTKVRRKLPVKIQPQKTKQTQEDNRKTEDCSDAHHNNNIKYKSSYNETRVTKKKNKTSLEHNYHVNTKSQNIHNDQFFKVEKKSEIDQNSQKKHTIGVDQFNTPFSDDSLKNSYSEFSHQYNTDKQGTGNDEETFTVKNISHEFSNEHSLDTIQQRTSDPLNKLFSSLSNVGEDKLDKLLSHLQDNGDEEGCFDDDINVPTSDDIKAINPPLVKRGRKVSTSSSDSGQEDGHNEDPSGFLLFKNIADPKEDDHLAALENPVTVRKKEQPSHFGDFLSGLLGSLLTGGLMGGLQSQPIDKPNNDSPFTVHLKGDAGEGNQPRITPNPILINNNSIFADKPDNLNQKNINITHEINHIDTSNNQHKIQIDHNVDVGSDEDNHNIQIHHRINPANDNPNNIGENGDTLDLLNKIFGHPDNNFNNVDNNSDAKPYLNPMNFINLIPKDNQPEPVVRVNGKPSPNGDPSSAFRKQEPNSDSSYSSSSDEQSHHDVDEDDTLNKYPLIIDDIKNTPFGKGKGAIIQFPHGESFDSDEQDQLNNLKKIIDNGNKPDPLASLLSGLMGPNKGNNPNNKNSMPLFDGNLPNKDNKPGNKDGVPGDLLSMFLPNKNNKPDNKGDMPQDLLSMLFSGDKKPNQDQPSLIPPNNGGKLFNLPDDLINGLKKDSPNDPNRRRPDNGLPDDPNRRRPDNGLPGDPNRGNPDDMGSLLNMLLGNLNPNKNLKGNQPDGKLNIERVIDPNDLVPNNVTMNDKPNNKRKPFYKGKPKSSSSNSSSDESDPISDMLNGISGGKGRKRPRGKGKSSDSSSDDSEPTVNIPNNFDPYLPSINIDGQNIPLNDPERNREDSSESDEDDGKPKKKSIGIQTDSDPINLIDNEDGRLKPGFKVVLGLDTKDPNARQKDPNENLIVPEKDCLNGDCDEEMEEDLRHILNIDDNKKIL